MERIKIMYKIQRIPKSIDFWKGECYNKTTVGSGIVIL